MNRSLTNYTISVAVAVVIDAQPLRCWRNAVLATLMVPELFVGGAYVEGWIVMPRRQVIMIVEHGWCISPKAGIVDPSIVLIEDQGQHVRYFPGFELSGDVVPQQIAGKTVPFVCNSEYGRDGMGHQGYKHSYEKAWQFAQELAQERHFPQSAIKVSTRDDRRGITMIVQN